MLKGRNEFFFCQSQMMEAIEWYLNTILFKEPVKVKVTKIQHVQSGATEHFVITMDEKKGE